MPNATNLLDRSRLNAQLAERLVDENEYGHIAPPCMYYSVYQHIKYILVLNKFDYQAFLRVNPKYTDDRVYSHRTIAAAFFYYIVYNSGVKVKLPNLSDLQRFNHDIELLKRYRIQSHYKPTCTLGNEVIRKALKMMEALHNIIDRVCE